MTALRAAQHSRLTLSIAALSLIVLAALPAEGAHAADRSKKETAKETAEKAAPTTVPSVMPDAMQGQSSFRVDMVMSHEGKSYKMTRIIDGAKTRMETSAEGMDMIQIVLDDPAGTMYTLMPKEKRAIKQSRAALEKLTAAQAPKVSGAPEAAAEPQAKVEFLGKDTIDGRPADKYRASYEQGSGLMWFDSAKKLPLRMEAQGAVVEFKNYKFGPQPAELFQPPKGYEITDMDAMMANMPKGMAGNLGSLAGMGSMGGMGSMAGGMAKGMAGNMGGTMGGTMGGALGGALGGPIGSMIGQFVGQKIGSKIGEAAAGAVLPGK